MGCREKTSSYNYKLRWSNFVLVFSLLDHIVTIDRVRVLEKLLGGIFLEFKLILGGLLGCDIAQDFAVR